MRAVIYTQRVEIVDAYEERRDCADQRIADFIRECGFLPLPLPNKRELAAEMVSSIKPAGIILTGGNSLEKYGGNAPERDGMDRALIELGIRRRIPLYGFCRGMQSILDYFGNQLMEVKGHVAVRHLVYEGEKTYEVNSYHNQACVELERSCGLRSMSQAEDGVIEAVCHQCLPIVGTMWHPEREKEFAAQDIGRIKVLFRERKNG
ncbi:MAG: C26 family cysteine hydrolase domain-containing family [Dorea sp.]|uniref:gamma-glutamyl-gamma-aminobutyrate hydrolase family protein n=1 Tax=Sporofaciens musculi TaxID=2681861 RepID=UPI002170C838|nr:gamma-glutamyl-gamma-aminobutyrate hydrolase family protein [Sporofaciens musculi]MCI9423344.1 C26 family cysteine hydrolase domain-containing family [Dorea sp.]